MRNLSFQTKLFIQYSLVVVLIIVLSVAAFHRCGFLFMQQPLVFFRRRMIL